MSSKPFHCRKGAPSAPFVIGEPNPIAAHTPGTKKIPGCRTRNHSLPRSQQQESYANDRTSEDDGSQESKVNTYNPEDWEVMEIRYVDTRNSSRSVSPVHIHPHANGHAGPTPGDNVLKQTVLVQKVVITDLLDKTRQVCGERTSSRLSEYLIEDQRKPPTSACQYYESSSQSSWQQTEPQFFECGEYQEIHGDPGFSKQKKIIKPDMVYQSSRPSDVGSAGSEKMKTPTCYSSVCCRSKVPSGLSKLSGQSCTLETDPSMTKVKPRAKRGVTPVVNYTSTPLPSGSYVEHMNEQKANVVSKEVLDEYRNAAFEVLLQRKLQTAKTMGNDYSSKPSEMTSSITTSSWNELENEPSISHTNKNSTPSERKKKIVRKAKLRQQCQLGSTESKKMGNNTMGSRITEQINKHRDRLKRVYGNSATMGSSVPQTNTKQPLHARGGVKKMSPKAIKREQNYSNRRGHLPVAEYKSRCAPSNENPEGRPSFENNILHDRGRKDHRLKRSRETSQPKSSISPLDGVIPSPTAETAQALCHSHQDVKRGKTTSQEFLNEPRISVDEILKAYNETFTDSKKQEGDFELESQDFALSKEKIIHRKSTPRQSQMGTFKKEKSLKNMQLSKCCSYKRKLSNDIMVDEKAACSWTPSPPLIVSHAYLTSLSSKSVANRLSPSLQHRRKHASICEGKAGSKCVQEQGEKASPESNVTDKLSQRSVEKPELINIMGMKRQNSYSMIHMKRLRTLSRKNSLTDCNHFDHTNHTKTRPWKREHSFIKFEHQRDRSMQEYSEGRHRSQSFEIRGKNSTTPTIDLLEFQVNSDGSKKDSESTTTTMAQNESSISASNKMKSGIGSKSSYDVDNNDVGKTEPYPPKKSLSLHKNELKPHIYRKDSKEEVKDSNSKPIFFSPFSKNTIDEFNHEVIFKLPAKRQENKGGGKSKKYHSVDFFQLTETVELRGPPSKEQTHSLNKKGEDELIYMPYSGDQMFPNSEEFTPGSSQTAAFSESDSPDSSCGKVSKAIMTGGKLEDSNLPNTPGIFGNNDIDNLEKENSPTANGDPRYCIAELPNGSIGITSSNENEKVQLDNEISMIKEENNGDPKTSMAIKQLEMRDSSVQVSGKLDLPLVWSKDKLEMQIRQGGLKQTHESTSCPTLNLHEEMRIQKSNYIFSADKPPKAFKALSPESKNKFETNDHSCRERNSLVIQDTVKDICVKQHEEITQIDKTQPAMSCVPVYYCEDGKNKMSSESGEIGEEYQLQDRQSNETGVLAKRNSQREDEMLQFLQPPQESHSKESEQSAKEGQNNIALSVSTREQHTHDVLSPTGHQTNFGVFAISEQDRYIFFMARAISEQLNKCVFEIKQKDLTYRKPTENNLEPDVLICSTGTERLAHEEGISQVIGNLNSVSLLLESEPIHTIAPMNSDVPVPQVTAIFSDKQMLLPSVESHTKLPESEKEFKTTLSWRHPAQDTQTLPSCITPRALSMGKIQPITSEPQTNSETEVSTGYKCPTESIQIDPILLKPVEKYISVTCGNMADSRSFAISVIAQTSNLLKSSHSVINPVGLNPPDAEIDLIPKEESASDEPQLMTPKDQERPEKTNDETEVTTFSSCSETEQYPRSSVQANLSASTRKRLEQSRYCFKTLISTFAKRAMQMDNARIDKAKTYITVTRGATENPKIKTTKYHFPTYQPSHQHETGNLMVTELRRLKEIYLHAPETFLIDLNIESSFCERQYQFENCSTALVSTVNVTLCDNTDLNHAPSLFLEDCNKIVTSVAPTSTIRKQTSAVPERCLPEGATDRDIMQEELSDRGKRDLGKDRSDTRRKEMGADGSLYQERTINERDRKKNNKNERKQGLDYESAATLKRKREERQAIRTENQFENENRENFNESFFSGLGYFILEKVGGENEKNIHDAEEKMCEEKDAVSEISIIMKTQRTDSQADITDGHSDSRAKEPVWSLCHERNQFMANDRPQGMGVSTTPSGKGKVNIRGDEMFLAPPRSSLANSTLSCSQPNGHPSCSPCPPSNSCFHRPSRYSWRILPSSDSFFSSQRCDKDKQIEQAISSAVSQAGVHFLNDLAARLTINLTSALGDLLLNQTPPQSMKTCRSRGTCKDKCRRAGLLDNQEASFLNGSLQSRSENTNFMHSIISQESSQLRIDATTTKQEEEYRSGIFNSQSDLSELDEEICAEMSLHTDNDALVSITYFGTDHNDKYIPHDRRKEQEKSYPGQKRYLHPRGKILSSKEKQSDNATQTKGENTLKSKDDMSISYGNQMNNLSNNEQGTENLITIIRSLSAEMERLLRFDNFQNIRKKTRGTVVYRKDSPPRTSIHHEHNSPNEERSVVRNSTFIVQRCHLGKEEYNLNPSHSKSLPNIYPNQIKNSEGPATSRKLLKKGEFKLGQMKESNHTFAPPKYFSFHHSREISIDDKRSFLRTMSAYKSSSDTSLDRKGISLEHRQLKAVARKRCHSVHVSHCPLGHFITRNAVVPRQLCQDKSCAYSKKDQRKAQFQGKRNQYRDFPLELEDENALNSNLVINNCFCRQDFPLGLYDQLDCWGTLSAQCKDYELDTFIEIGSFMTEMQTLDTTYCPRDCQHSAACCCKSFLPEEKNSSSQQLPKSPLLKADEDYNSRCSTDTGLGRRRSNSCNCPNDLLSFVHPCQNGKSTLQGGCFSKTDDQSPQASLSCIEMFNLSKGTVFQSGHQSYEQSESSENLMETGTLGKSDFRVDQDGKIALFIILSSLLKFIMVSLQSWVNTRWLDEDQEADSLSAISSGEKTSAEIRFLHTQDSNSTISLEETSSLSSEQSYSLLNYEIDPFKSIALADEESSPSKHSEKRVGKKEIGKPLLSTSDVRAWSCKGENCGTPLHPSSCLHTSGRTLVQKVQSSPAITCELSMNHDSKEKDSMLNGIPNSSEEITLNKMASMNNVPLCCEKTEQKYQNICSSFHVDAGPVATYTLSSKVDDFQVVCIEEESPIDTFCSSDTFMYKPLIYEGLCLDLDVPRKPKTNQFSNVKSQLHTTSANSWPWAETSKVVDASSKTSHKDLSAVIKGTSSKEQNGLHSCRYHKKSNATPRKAVSLEVVQQLGEYENHCFFASEKLRNCSYDNMSSNFPTETETQSRNIGQSYTRSNDDLHMSHLFYECCDDNDIDIHQDTEAYNELSDAHITNHTEECENDIALRDHLQSPDKGIFAENKESGENSFENLGEETIKQSEANGSNLKSGVSKVQLNPRDEGATCQGHEQITDPLTETSTFWYTVSNRYGDLDVSDEFDKISGNSQSSSNVDLGMKNILSVCMRSDTENNKPDFHLKTLQRILSEMHQMFGDNLLTKGRAAVKARKSSTDNLFHNEENSTTSKDILHALCVDFSHPWQCLEDTNTTGTLPADEVEVCLENSLIGKVNCKRQTTPDKGKETKDTGQSKTFKTECPGNHKETSGIVISSDPLKYKCNARDKNSSVPLYLLGEKRNLDFSNVLKSSQSEKCCVKDRSLHFEDSEMKIFKENESNGFECKSPKFVESREDIERDYHSLPLADSMRVDANHDLFATHEGTCTCFACNVVPTFNVFKNEQKRGLTVKKEIAREGKSWTNSPLHNQEGEETTDFTTEKKESEHNFDSNSPHSRAKYLFVKDENGNDHFQDGSVKDIEITSQIVGEDLGGELNNSFFPLNEDFSFTTENTYFEKESQTLCSIDEACSKDLISANPPGESLAGHNTRIQIAHQPLSEECPNILNIGMPQSKNEEMQNPSDQTMSCRITGPLQPFQTSLKENSTVGCCTGSNLVYGGEKWELHNLYLTDEPAPIPQSFDDSLSWNNTDYQYSFHLPEQGDNPTLQESSVNCQNLCENESCHLLCQDAEEENSSLPTQNGDKEMIQMHPGNLLSFLINKTLVLNSKDISEKQETFPNNASTPEKRKKDHCQKDDDIKPAQNPGSMTISNSSKMSFCSDHGKFSSDGSNTQEPNIETEASLFDHQNGEEKMLRLFSSISEQDKSTNAGNISSNPLSSAGNPNEYLLLMQFNSNEQDDETDTADIQVSSQYNTAPREETLGSFHDIVPLELQHTRPKRSNHFKRNCLGLPPLNKSHISSVSSHNETACSHKEQYLEYLSPNLACRRHLKHISKPKQAWAEQDLKDKHYQFMSSDIEIRCTKKKCRTYCKGRASEQRKRKEKMPATDLGHKNFFPSTKIDYRYTPNFILPKTDLPYRHEKVLTQTPVLHPVYMKQRTRPFFNNQETANISSGLHPQSNIPTSRDKSSSKISSKSTRHKKTLGELKSLPVEITCGSAAQIIEDFKRSKAKPSQIPIDIYTVHSKSYLSHVNEEGRGKRTKDKGFVRTLSISGPLMNISVPVRHYDFRDFQDTDGCSVSEEKEKNESQYSPKLQESIGARSVKGTSESGQIKVTTKIVSPQSGCEGKNDHAKPKWRDVMWKMLPFGRKKHKRKKMNNLKKIPRVPS